MSHPYDVIDHPFEILLRFIIEGIIDIGKPVREACRPVEGFLLDAEPFRIFGGEQVLDDRLPLKDLGDGGGVYPLFLGDGYEFVPGIIPIHEHQGVSLDRHDLLEDVRGAVLAAAGILKSEIYGMKNPKSTE